MPCPSQRRTRTHRGGYPTVRFARMDREAGTDVLTVVESLGAAVADGQVGWAVADGGEWCEPRWPCSAAQFADLFA